MAESPVEESTASPTMMTSRVGVRVQTKGKESLGLEASSLALKTQLHNNSNRPIFLIPIRRRHDQDPLSSCIVEEQLVKCIPAGGLIEVACREYDVSGTSLDSKIYILFRAGETDNLEKFLRDLHNRHPRGVKLGAGEKLFLDSYLVGKRDLYLECSNEGKVIVGSEASQLAPTTMAESPVEESTASPTMKTSRVGVGVQTKAKESLGLEASSLALKTQLHNNSHRPIFLIPIRRRHDQDPLSSCIVEEQLVKCIPAGGLIEVACREYDVSGTSLDSKIYILFRAGETDNLEKFLRDLHNRHPRGVKLGAGEKLFLHSDLVGKRDLYLECSNEGKVIVGGEASQLAPTTMAESPVEESTASPTMKTSRVGVGVQTKAKESLGLEASSLALKIQLHNNSNRPIFLIPIRRRHDQDPLSSCIVEEQLVKCIPAGGLIEVACREYDVSGTSLDSEIYILFRVGETDNLEKFLRDLDNKHPRGVKLGAGEKLFLHSHLVGKRDLYLECSNEGKVIVGGEASQLAPTTMAESPVEESTASPTMTTSRVGVGVQTKAKESLGLEASSLALKTQLHNNSNRPIFLIPIRRRHDQDPLSSCIVEEQLVKCIPAGGLIEVACREYDVSGTSLDSKIYILFRAGETDNLEKFLRDLHNRHPRGVKLGAGEKLFLHSDLVGKRDLYLECSNEGKVIVGGEASQLAPTTMAESPVEESTASPTMKTSRVGVGVQTKAKESLGLEASSLALKIQLHNNSNRPIFLIPIRRRHDQDPLSSCIVEEQLVKCIPAGGLIEVACREYDVSGTSLDSEIYILFRVGETDNLEKFLRDLDNKHPRGVKLGAGEKLFLHSHLVGKRDLYLECSNEGKVIVGGEASQLAPTTMAESPVEESTASPTMTTSRVGVGVQTKAKESLGLEASSLALKTRLHNYSNRPIFLIPVRCLVDEDPSSNAIVSERRVICIPERGLIEVACREYDRRGQNSNWETFILFRAGETDNLEKFQRDLHSRRPMGLKLEPGERFFHHSDLVDKRDLYLECNEGKVIVGSEASQLAPTTMAELPVEESTASLTMMTSRVGVRVQTKAKESLGPEASGLAPKTRLHNNSSRHIFLIPICCRDGHDLRLSGMVRERLAKHIPAGGSLEVDSSEYDLSGRNFDSQMYVIFRAGDTDNVEEFLKDFLDEGGKVEPGEEVFLYSHLDKRDLYLECYEAKDMGDVNAGQQHPASPEERTVTETGGGQQISIAGNRLSLGMEFFLNAKTVFLWSRDGQYLVAEDKEVIALCDEKTRERDRARWFVEFVDNSDSVLRLKSCKGKYLTASKQPFHPGMSSHKVLQSLPPLLDTSLELEPMMEGPHVKLRTHCGTFLCAYGELLMDPNFITHDLPQRTTILWDVEVVEREFSKELDLTEAKDRFIPEEHFNETDVTSLIFKNSSIEVISGSIGKLKHLESLNAKNSLVTELPPEVASLKKLCDIRIYRYDKDPPTESPNLIGFKAQCSVKEFECLEKLGFVESDISLLNDLGSLTKLRRLGITKFRKGHGQSLCTSFGKLKKLKSLNIHALGQAEILDLHYQTSPPKSLRHLYLHGRLEKLPDWISSRSLPYLTKLILKWSHLKEDLLETLGELPKLVELQLHRAYDGEQLNFKNMQFPRLKIFLLHDLEGLRSMSFEPGTLLRLEILTISCCQWLKEIPSDIENIHPTKLTLSDMSHEFYEKAKADHEKEGYQIFKHIEEVYFTRWRAGYWETRTSERTEDVKASPGNPE